jgi:hypothetical protein
MSMMIKDAQQKLLQLSTKIARLEKAVDRAIAPAPEFTKQVPVWFTVSFTFEWGDMRIQEQTIKNGAEDVRLHGFTYHASLTDSGVEQGLADTSVGLARLDEAVIASRPVQRFDFTWDYRVSRSQQTYLNPVGSRFLLSRQSLGRKETQRHLFYENRPLKFEAGGALTFKVQPMCYEALSTTDTIYVQMIAYGTRGGRMAQEVVL